MQLCPYCRQETEDSATICPTCGAQLGQPPIPAQPAPVQPASIPAQPAPVQPASIPVQPASIPAQPAFVPAQPAPVPMQTPFPAQTPVPAPISVPAPKKKKTALIVGIAAAVAVVILAAMLVIVLTGKKNGGEQGNVPSEQSAEAEDDVPDAELALIVGDRRVSEAEFGYYYHNVYMSYAQQAQTMQETYGFNLTGFDWTKSPAEQTSDDKTFDEIFREKAIAMLEEDAYYTGLAEENGVTLNEEKRTAIEDLLREFEISAGEIGVTQDDYISAVYGPRMSAAFLRRLLTRQYLADQYKNERDGISVSDEELEEAYRKDPTPYNAVDICLFGLSLDEDGAEERIAEMLGKVTDEGSFIRLAQEYAAEEDKATFADPDNTLQVGIKYNTIATNFDGELADWLFAPERQVGDKRTCKNEKYAFAIMIQKPSYREERPLVSVRHILISFDSVAEKLQNADPAVDVNSQGTAEKTASDGTVISNTGTGYSVDVVLQAYEDARAILERYQKGDQSEDAFATLAEDYSDDIGSVGEGTGGGGLYADIPLGQMVKPFENWIYDGRRQPGDVGLVKTSYGWHVMYFVSRHTEPQWKEDVRDALIEAKTDEMEEADKIAYEGTAQKGPAFDKAAEQALRVVENLLKKQP